MDETIRVVTTPLALAALAVLVFGAVYQARAGRGKSGQQLFWIILVFGILGTGSYLLQMVLLSEAIIQGDVRDQGGTPIKFAVIDIPGVGTTASGENGTFQIQAPYSRQADEYRIIFRAAGYAPQTNSLPGPRPPFKSFVLSPVVVSLSDYVDLRDRVSISQNLGDPLLIYSFRVKSSVPGRIKLSDLQIRLDGPDGNKQTFHPVFFQRNGQPWFHPVRC